MLNSLSMIVTDRTALVRDSVTTSDISQTKNIIRKILEVVKLIRTQPSLFEVLREFLFYNHLLLSPYGKFQRMRRNGLIQNMSEIQARYYDQSQWAFLDGRSDISSVVHYHVPGESCSPHPICLPEKHSYYHGLVRRVLIWQLPIKSPTSERD